MQPTYPRILISPVLVICYLFLNATVQAEEPRSRIERFVRPIDWARFKKKLPFDEGRDICARLFLNAVRHNIGDVKKSYRLSEKGDRFLVANKNHESVIRPSCSVCASLAVAIKTGLIAANSKLAGIDEKEAIELTAKLVKGTAAVHKANGGKWGNHWQSSLWAGLLGRAGWMLWNDLDAETQEMVCKVVEYEANRYIRKGYKVPYWNGKGGDSKAEENAWNSMVIQQAVVMMPEHPNVARWKTVCSELMISSFARKSDQSRNVPKLDGKSPGEWLRGFNLREDGMVINHNRIHNDYMCTPTLTMQSFLLCSLARMPVPETADFNFDVIYKAFITRKFKSPPYKKPGGTMYIEGKPEQYYPQGTDWSRYRFVTFYLMDTYAHVLGYDKELPHSALSWLKLRGRKILEMQSRHTDGRMYARGEYDRYKGIEPYLLWKLSDAYLLQWLAGHRALSKKANWLSRVTANSTIPRCGTEAWYLEVERRTGVVDKDGHGPDTNSREWLEAVSRKVKVYDDQGHGPDLDSGEWKRCVHRKVFKEEPKN